MSLKLLPPPRAWQKTAPVFGGRTVLSDHCHTTLRHEHRRGKIFAHGGYYENT